MGSCILEGVVVACGEWNTGSSRASGATCGRGEGGGVSGADTRVVTTGEWCGGEVGKCSGGWSDRGAGVASICRAWQKSCDCGRDREIAGVGRVATAGVGPDAVPVDSGCGESGVGVGGGIGCGVADFSERTGGA